MELLKNLLFVVAIPALLSVGMLLIAGGADGVYRHEGIVRFDHPKEQVLEWLSEPARRVQWIQDLQTSACDRNAVQKGASLREVLGTGVERRQRTVEILEVEYGESFAYRVSEPGRTVEVRMKVGVLNTSRRTRMDYAYSCTFETWWDRLLEPILGSRQIDALEADLARLDVAMRDA